MKNRLLGEVRVASSSPPAPPWDRASLVAAIEDLRREEAAGEKAKGDLIVAKTLRFATWGLGAILVLFVTYIIATLYIGAHDNRRIDELEQRVDRLEHQRKDR